ARVPPASRTASRRPREEARHETIDEPDGGRSTRRGGVERVRAQTGTHDVGTAAAGGGGGGCRPTPARMRWAPPPMAKVESVSGPHFAFNTSDLTPEGRAKVRGLAATLNKYPARRVDLYGYTDSTGRDAPNP